MENEIKDPQTETPDPKVVMKAYSKLMLYLSKRDHSIAELKKKLSKHFTFEEILGALEIAQADGVLRTAHEISEQLYAELNRKNKSYLYILKQWYQKSLPKLDMDREVELEKARNLVIKRWPNSESKSLEVQKKIYQFLVQRGFDESTSRTVAKEKRES